MLGNRPFFFSLLKKYTAIVGTLFNEIRIQRFTPDGSVKEELRVPLSYGPKEKVLARLESEPEVDRKAAVTLPRISFEMGSPVYDPDDRQLNQIGQWVVSDDGGSYKRQYNPVPYNIPFKVWVYSRTVEDGHKIIEQILPAFEPEYPVTAELIPEMQLTLDIPVVLNSVTLSDTYASDYRERRLLTWELGLTVKGWLFGPVRQHPVIKFVDVKLYNATTYDRISDAYGEIDPIDRVTMQPGLLANGSPTTNAAASIPYAEIEEDDDWGYAGVIYGSLVPGDIGGEEGDTTPIEDE